MKKQEAKKVILERWDELPHDKKTDEYALDFILRLCADEPDLMRFEVNGIQEIIDWLTQSH